MEASWAILEASWAILEASWAILEASWKCRKRWNFQGLGGGRGERGGAEGIWEELAARKGIIKKKFKEKVYCEQGER